MDLRHAIYFFIAKVVVSTVRLVHTFFIYLDFWSNPITSKSSNPNSVPDQFDLSFLLKHLLVRFVTYIQPCATELKPLVVPRVADPHSFHPDPDPAF